MEWFNFYLIWSNLKYKIKSLKTGLVVGQKGWPDLTREKTSWVWANSFLPHVKIYWVQVGQFPLGSDSGSVNESKSNFAKFTLSPLS